MLMMRAVRVGECCCAGAADSCGGYCSVGSKYQQMHAPCCSPARSVAQEAGCNVTVYFNPSIHGMRVRCAEHGRLNTSARPTAACGAVISCWPARSHKVARLVGGRASRPASSNLVHFVLTTRDNGAFPLLWQDVMLTWYTGQFKDYTEMLADAAQARLAACRTPCTRRACTACVP